MPPGRSPIPATGPWGPMPARPPWWPSSTTTTAAGGSANVLESGIARSLTEPAFGTGFMRMTAVDDSEDAGRAVGRRGERRRSPTPKP